MKIKLSKKGLLILWLCCVVGITPFSKRLVSEVMLRFDPGYDLVFGAFYGNIPQMNRALQYGANVNARGGHANRTALMAAAIHDKPQAARFLLSNGADPKIRDEKGYTALSLANQQHYAATAQVLLAAGAVP